MRVGFTYDLKKDYLAEGYSEEETAEFDSPTTINAIADVMTNRGWQVDHIGGVKKLVERLANGDRWDCVFNYCEGFRAPGREAQTAGLLEAYRIPYTFSDPMVLAYTLDKAITKKVLANIVPTAAFSLISRVEECDLVTLPYPLFVKPNGEGSSMGVNADSFVHNPKQLRLAVEKRLKTFKGAVLVERALTGRDFTVGIVGTGRSARALGTLEIVARKQTGDFQAHVFADQEECDYVLATDAEGERAADVALQAWRALDCRDGGRVDVRSDANGNPHFLEVNPLPGLNPEVSDFILLAKQAGISYDTLVNMILDAFLDRTGLGKGTSRKSKVA